MCFEWTKTKVFCVRAHLPSLLAPPATFPPRRSLAKRALPMMAPGAPCTALAVAALSVVLAVSAASPDAYGPARNDPTYRTDWRTMPRERAVPAHARGRRAFGDTDYGTLTSASPQRGLGGHGAGTQPAWLIAPSATVPCRAFPAAPLPQAS